MRRSFIKGFTLAEVLITLTIIGVIAALTIPSLIQDIQDAQYKVEWRQIFSEFNQATNQIKNDNGGTLVGVFQNHNDVRDKYLTYMPYLKACPSGSLSGNCWHLDNAWYGLNKTPQINWGGSGAILNRGSFALFYYTNTNCAALSGTIPYCGTVYIDVNGWNPPNTIGRDIYGFIITDNALKPYGSNGDSKPISACGPAYDSWACSAKYLTQ